MRVLGIIPARYDSTRLPGKALADLAGKPLIAHVAERCSRCSVLDEVWVATDHEGIAEAAAAVGVRAVMTDSTLRNGTERCLQAIRRSGGNWDVVVNIQGDEPWVECGQLRELTALFANPECRIGTLIKSIEDRKLAERSSIVKVVIDRLGRALYFSRRAIPHNPSTDGFYKHIGLYAFRTDTLHKLGELPEGRLERAESLEQLRWLEHGFEIHTAVTAFETFSIDTPQDLEEARQRWTELSSQP